MLKNYLITALRNLVRHKLYSFINIAGLAIGLTSAILVILFVRDELSYDKWIPGTQNLYRLEMSFLSQDRPPLAMAVIPYPMPEAMRDEIPGVTGMTRVFQNPMTLTVGNRQFRENALSVDPGFFKLIGLPLVAGDADSVFRQPQSLVLSQSAARKYFGDANPLGRILTTPRSDCGDDQTACRAEIVSLKVTGVMKDIPHNSQLTGDVFLPNSSIADATSEEIKHDWFSQNGWGYVRLAPGADPKAVIAAMKPLLDRDVTPALRKAGILSRGSQAYVIHLTPFTEVHLNSSHWLYNMTAPGSWTMVYGTIALGLLILVVACVNFMNLATARAMLRAREIGLRKTVGASRRQLIVQFLGEAVLIALLALVLALAAAEMLLPILDNFLGHPIALNYGTDGPLLLGLVALAVAAGLISGIYPALVLSSFRPALTLRSAGQAGSGGLRNLLVVLQFAVSIGLGIAAAVVFSQISFAQTMALGFRHDNVLVLSSAKLLTVQQRHALVETLRANRGVIDIGMSSQMPFQEGQAHTYIQIPGQSDTIDLNWIAIDPGYPEVYGIHLVAGRMLSQTRGDDRLHSMLSGPDPLNEGRNLLINAAAAHRLGFTPEEAVGKTILFNHSRVRIVGVLADAKIKGAREPVEPTAYPYIPEYPMQIAIRLRPDRTPQTLDFIDHTWHAFSPTHALQRYFIDDSFAQLYQSDERLGTIFGSFVLVAVFIACLGLFGLAAFTAGRRTREIGIRKVFGARARDVVLLLLWQFSIPVLIANAIAWPLAWIYLRGWLHSFADHIALSPLYFVGAGVIAMVIAWGTVFVHAHRVAGANPIHALRYE